MQIRQQNDDFQDFGLCKKLCNLQTPCSWDPKMERYFGVDLWGVAEDHFWLGAKRRVPQPLPQRELQVLAGYVAYDEQVLDVVDHREPTELIPDSGGERGDEWIVCVCGCTHEIHFENT